MMLKHCGLGESHGGTLINQIHLYLLCQNLDTHQMKQASDQIGTWTTNNNTLTTFLNQWAEHAKKLSIVQSHILSQDPRTDLTQQP
jgi:hypothetical protein